MRFVHPEILLKSHNTEKTLLLRLKSSKNKDHINNLVLMYLPSHKDKIMDINVYVPSDKTSKIGKVIGKGGCKLKEIERISNTRIRLRRDGKVHFNVIREADGDLWIAQDMINCILADEQQDSEAREYTDWEKYYYWWYYYNVENKNKHH